jgi:hypothetical protein
MRILLQPASGRDALEHFSTTIDPGVLVESLKGKVPGSVFSKISSLHEKYIKVWGIVPTVNNTPRNEWSDLQEDDIVFFYGKRSFYYFAKVLTTDHNKPLAEQFWGFDDQNRTWEYIYYIKEGKQIQIPYEPEVLGYSDKHVIQGAMLLDEVKSQILIKHIENQIGILIDEDSVQPTALEEAILTAKIKIPQTPEEAQAAIEELSKSYANQPVKEKIKAAKVLARNPVFARLVKERAEYICDVCGANPFMQKNGIPYAEAHHVDELALSRIDDPKKMMCVCPTCHKVIHYGNEESLQQRQTLKSL